MSYLTAVIVDPLELQSDMQILQLYGGVCQQSTEMQVDKNARKGRPSIMGFVFFPY